MLAAPSLTINTSTWLVIPRATGPGLTDDGAPTGRTVTGQGTGLTDDGADPGVTDDLQSLGRTE
jgi:hypothetical protein